MIGIYKMYSEEGELEAIKFFEDVLWHLNEGQICPHCDSKRKFYKIKTKSRLGLWKCADCRKQFTIRVNQMFDGSPLPLAYWKRAIEIIDFGGEENFYRNIEDELNITRVTSIYLKYRLQNEKDFMDSKQIHKTFIMMEKQGLLKRVRTPSRTTIMKTQDKWLAI